VEKFINLGYISKEKGLNIVAKTEEYIVDKNGRKKSVILDIKEYEERHQS